MCLSRKTMSVEVAGGIPPGKTLGILGLFVAGLPVTAHHDMGTFIARAEGCCTPRNGGVLGNPIDLGIPVEFADCIERDTYMTDTSNKIATIVQEFICF